MMNSQSGTGSKTNQKNTPPPSPVRAATAMRSAAEPRTRLAFALFSKSKSKISPPCAASVKGNKNERNQIPQEKSVHPAPGGKCWKNDTGRSGHTRLLLSWDGTYHRTHHSYIFSRSSRKNTTDYIVAQKERKWKRYKDMTNGKPHHRTNRSRSLTAISAVRRFTKVTT